MDISTHKNELLLQKQSLDVYSAKIQDLSPPYCQIEKPGTPSSPSLTSIRGANSDNSEAFSGETVPSSFAEENLNTSEYTLPVQKLRDSELDLGTVTEMTPKPIQETQKKHSESHDQSAVDFAQSDSNKHREFRLSDEIIQELESNKYQTEVIKPTSPRVTAARKLSSDVNRHRESYESDQRPQLKQFLSLRRIPTKLWHKEKSKNSSRQLSEETAHKQSAQDAEIARMKQSLIKKNIQKRNLMEEETVLLGNKISEGHKNFVMAYNMLTGIRVAVLRCSGVMSKLTDQDFSTTTKLKFNMEGSEVTPSSKYEFKFKDYAPEVFRELRSMFGIDPADYLMSITGKCILSELGSTGKSGSFFYYSRDFRFIIKTIHHSEHKQLRRILKDYHLHVKSNPNTLISQFYGLHRLKVNGGMRTIHFIVMNNLFPPHRDIHLKYDLKGSTWGRYTNLAKDGDKQPDLSSVTLKDLNWLERQDHIKFGPDKKKIFLEQLEADVSLLKKINVMDYSLLLGVHDVKLGNTANHAKLSVFDPKSNLKEEVFKTNPRDIDRGTDLPKDVFPGRSKYIFYGHNGGIRATNASNEPISEIYYLGIIDCLTNYNFKKRLETMWRSFNHSKSTISAIPASEYGDRLVKFIKEGIISERAKTA